MRVQVDTTWVSDWEGSKVGHPTIQTVNLVTKKGFIYDVNGEPIEADVDMYVDAKTNTVLEIWVTTDGK